MFRENVDRRIFLGAMAILAGALLLSWSEAAAGPRLNWGSVLIVLACVSWGIDNNLTRKLSAADPLQIAMIKGLAAGAVNLALALAGRGAVAGARNGRRRGHGRLLRLRGQLGPLCAGASALGSRAHWRLLLDGSLYRCSPGGDDRSESRRRRPPASASTRLSAPSGPT